MLQDAEVAEESEQPAFKYFKGQLLFKPLISTDDRCDCNPVLEMVNYAISKLNGGFRWLSPSADSLK